MLRFVSLFACIFFFINLHSQHKSLNQEGLQNLLTFLDQEKSERKARIQTFLNKKSNTWSKLISQPEVMLYDVIDGQPIFLSTANKDAATAINIDSVRIDGGMGLNLTGKGLEVGIWDGGIIRTTHQELKGRIRYQDGAAGSQFSDHATSVAGTLIGSGIMDRAKGMAYEADVVAYDFNDDEEEMVKAQIQRQLILSNHSYGPIRGWNDNTWLGDPNISEVEDWRFGYYDSQARIWDEIAYNAPYYLIVKSAGNDRGENGTSANFPPDGPFDCIAGSGVSKNIITVGAIRKSRNGYQAPSNIEMSSFSGWGPTDDGRIKPDLVAVGVDIYSPDAVNDESYSPTQGTSFSSPSAAGGLLLLQQLQKQQANQFMRAATLKALAIQTAKEAGTTVGPDYKFGWGLLDVGNAADLLLAKDQVNTYIIEDSISNDSEYILELNPKLNSPFKATLVWTDPAGTPVSSALDPTDLMLVNDLDMRVVDETGAEFFPYLLDPSNPNRAATKSDNFRDNVEQIVIGKLEPRKYFLKIGHKGELENLGQSFSLIIEYQSESNPVTNLYWVGDQDNWGGPGVWSNLSGGAVTTSAPNSDLRIIFDDASISSASATVKLDKDYTINGLSVFTDKSITLDLNGHSLTTKGPLIIGKPNFKIINGSINFSSEQEIQEILLNINHLITTDVDFSFLPSNQASWSINGSDFSISNLDIMGGSLKISNSQLSVNTIDVNTDAALIFGNSEMQNLQSLTLSASATYQDDGSSLLHFGTGQTLLNIADQKLKADILSAGDLTIQNVNGALGLVSASQGSLQFLNDILVQGLDVAAGAHVNLNSTALTVLSENFKLGDNAQLTGSNSSITLEIRKSYCFENLTIDGVDLEGNGVVTVGTQSIVSGEGWQKVNCDDLIFANFEVNYNCENALTELRSISKGKIDFYQWFVNGELATTSLDPIAYYTFQDSGIYSVSLLVTDPLDGGDQYTTDVFIDGSNIDSNYVIKNTTQLASFKSGDTYQWYMNDEPIAGATARTYPYNGEKAVFFVVVFRDGCNRKSAELDLSSSVINIDDNAENLEIKIGPNPVADWLLLDIPVDIPGKTSLKIYDALGRVAFELKDINKGSSSWSMTSLDSGVFYLKLQIGTEEFSKTFVKQ